jgi:hypothetical protein
VTTLTLAIKVSHGGQLKQVDEALKDAFEDLDVEVYLSGNPVHGWAQVSLQGEDEAIATSYVNREFGTCPVSLKAVTESAVLKGYISKVDAAKQELKVDVGVFEPKVIHATIPLASLQSQLANGRKGELAKISEAYSLVEGLPLSVKVIHVGGEELRAEFAAVQVDRLSGWRQSLLDRLIVLGASADAVKVVLERTRLDRDVIDAEALGMFEQALTCKLGTDAAGLIPKVGRYMRNGVFWVFNSEKCLNFWVNKD